MNIRTLGVIALATLVAGSASATTYRWTWNGVGANNNGGRIVAASSSYNNVSQRFTFETTLGNKPGTSTKSSGFWLAVSDGPNPKGTAGELPIFYFDASGSQPVLTAYGYNGQNGPSSWYDGNGVLAGNQAPDKIRTSKVNSSQWINSIQTINNADGTRTFKMDLKGSVINNFVPANGNPADWKGVEFANRFGLWFHPLTGVKTGYGHDGFLNKFEFRDQGWLDLSNQEAVPEPATIVALGLGAAAMLRRRKK